MAASLARVTGTSTGAGSNVTMAVPMPAEAYPGRLAVLTLCHERQAAGATIQAVEGSTAWVVERTVTSGTAMTVVNAWKYLTAADIAAGEVRVNVTATRRMAVTIAIAPGGGVPTFTHAAFVSGVGTVNTITHPSVAAPAGSVILDVAGVTSRAAQPLFPSTVESPTDTWLRTFTPGSGWTFATGAVQGTTQEGVVNAYAYTAHRLQATAGTVAPHTVTVDRSSNSVYASRVIIPPAVAGPTVDAGEARDVESWAEGVPLVGTFSDPSATVTGHTWRQVSSTPPGVTVDLTPGVGATATYTAPGTLTATDLTFGYRATNSDGVVSAEATVTHHLLPSTEAWIHPTDGPRPLQQVVMADFTPVPPSEVNEPPVAAFTATVTGNTVTATPTGSTDPDGTIVTYTWVWGDGATSTGNPGVHTYAGPAAYAVTLTVTDDDGTSTTTAPAAVTVAAVNPEPVTNLHLVSATDTSLTFGWTPSVSADAENYRIRKNGAYYGNVAHPGEQVTFPGLNPGTSYRVGVQTYDVDDNTSGNVELTAATTSATTVLPEPPTGLTATAGDGQAVLAWTLPTTGPAIASTRIYNAGALVATVTAPTATYTRTGLTNGSVYDYTARTVSGTVESADVAFPSVTPQPPIIPVESIAALAFDADPATVAAVGDGAAVASLTPNQAGTTKATLTQGDTTRQPLYALDSSRHALYGSGARYLSTSTDTSLLRNVTGYTLFAAFRTRPTSEFANSGTRTFLTGQDSGGATRGNLRLVDGRPAIYGRFGASTAGTLVQAPTSTADLRDAAVHLVVATVQATGADTAPTVTIYTDGTQVFTGPWTGQTGLATSDTAATAMSIVGSPSNTEQFGGWVYRVGAFNVALTAAQRNDLARTLGVTVTTDTGPITVVEPLQVDRSYYPDGTGKWAHLPPLVDPITREFVPPEQGGWPIAQWTPATARTQRMTPLQCVRWVFPQKVVDKNQGLNPVGGNWFFHAPHFKNTKYMGDPTQVWYATKADADAGVNGFPPRPGLTYWPGTDRADPNDRNRGIYVQATNTGSTTHPMFRGIEDAYFEGDWINEGIDVAPSGSYNDTGLEFSLQNVRHDQVSVNYGRDPVKVPVSYEEKTGGDFFQIWATLSKVWARNVTFRTNLQGFFLPGGLSHLDFENVNAVSLPDPPGAGSGYPFWLPSSLTTERMVNVYLQTTRSRDSAIWPKGSATGGTGQPIIIGAPAGGDYVKADAPIGLASPRRFV